MTIEFTVLWVISLCVLGLVFWLGVFVGRAAAWREGLCYVIGTQDLKPNKRETPVETVKAGNTVTNVIKRKRE